MLEHYFNEFLEHLKSLNYSKNTILSYENDLKEFLSFVKDKQIDKQLLRSYFIELFNRGYSQRTIIRKRASLNSFIKFLMKKKIIKENPLILISKIKVPKSLPKVISQNQINKILDSWEIKNFDDLLNKAIIETLYSTGLRASELCSLKVRDIYFENEQIKVMGKGSRQAIVPIGKKALNLIRLIIQEKNLKDDDFIFQISRFQLYYRVKKSFLKLSQIFRYSSSYIETFICYSFIR
jgi:site-specific recombinase XerD